MFQVWNLFGCFDFRLEKNNDGSQNFKKWTSVVKQFLKCAVERLRSFVSCNESSTSFTCHLVILSFIKDRLFVFCFQSSSMDTVERWCSPLASYLGCKKGYALKVVF